MSEILLQIGVSPVYFNGLGDENMWWQAVTEILLPHICSAGLYELKTFNRVVAKVLMRELK